MNRKIELVELEITDLAFNGKSIAHRDGKVVFLDRGLPGESVEAEIVRTKRRFDQGVVHRILRKSERRLGAICEHFGNCGGCTWQDLDYEEQLRFKRKQVLACLERIGGLGDVQVPEVIGAENQFYYRNKMEFSFHVTEDGGFTLGLHRRGRYDEIFDLRECHLQSQLSNQIVRWMRDFVAEENIPVYDVNHHTGFMRFLVIRQTARTEGVMVNVVTNAGEIPAKEKLVDQLCQAFSAVTTIVHNQNSRKSNIATGEIENTLWGPGHIEEQLFDCRFRIRANSFFQTNTLQAETLYRTAFEMLAPESSDRVLDLYSGTGSIGILLSKSVREVVGVELVADAVKAARENAEINGVSNIVFFEGNVRDVLKANPAAREGFDAVIVDPPRAGLHPRAVREIVTMKPRKLLYISCNPATFARDAGEFVQRGYRLPVIQALDMFPHTMHIELVGRFYLE